MNRYSLDGRLGFLGAALCSLASLSVATGCRAVGKAAGFRGAEEMHGVVWNSPLPDLVPPGPERNTLYLSVRDASGADIELRDEIRGRLQQAGYTLERDPDKAHYHLRATLRYFGENPAGDRGVSQANTMGAIVGVSTAAGTYAALRGAGVDSLPAPRSAA